MSSACTCHIDPEYCWWCLYEIEKDKNARLRKAIEEIYELSKHDGESMYLDICYVVARQALKQT